MTFMGTVFFDDGRLKLVDNFNRDGFIVFQENKPEEIFERPYPARLDELTPEWLAMMEAWTGNTLPWLFRGICFARMPPCHRPPPPVASSGPS